MQFNSAWHKQGNFLFKLSPLMPLSNHWLICDLQLVPHRYTTILLSCSFSGTNEDDQIIQLDGSYPFGYYIPTSESRVTLKFLSDGSFTFTGVNMTYFLEDSTPGRYLYLNKDYSRFSQTHKICKMGINTDFVISYNCSLLHYLAHITIIHVELDVSG